MSVENKTQTVDKNRPARRSNTGARIFTGIHTLFYRLSGGRLGGQFGKSPLLVAMYPSYAEYQKKTTREIPVVILHPEN